MLSLINTKNKAQVILLLIISVIFLWIANYTFDSKIAPLGDNSTYYLLGKSIAQGQGYTNIYSINESPANHFPPGYSLLIAGTIKITGAEISGIKIINYLFLYGAVLLLFFIIKKITSSIHTAFVVCILCIFNVQLLSFSTVMMSEIPFLFFSILALFFLLRSNQKFNRKDYNFWIFLLTLVFVYHIRTMGITILGATICFFIYSRRWKHLGITLIGFLLLSLPWYLRTESLGGGDYVRNLLLRNQFRPELGNMAFEDWLPRIGRNIERYLTKEIPVTIFPRQIDYSFSPTISDWILGISIIIIVSFGIFHIKKWRVLIGAYLVGTFSILLCWPEIWFGPRFIIPLIPLFILGITQTTVVIGNLITQQFFKNRKFLNPIIITYLPLVLVLFSFSGINLLHIEGGNDYPVNQKRYIEMAKWIDSNSPEDAIIACIKPSIFYLYSNRKAIRYKFTNDPEEFTNYLESKGVTHVIFDELGYRSYDHYLLPAANYDPAKFIQVFKYGNTPSQIILFRPDLGYFGERKNGSKHGKGKLIRYDGTIYNGMWLNNKQHGFGTFQWPSGQRYKGEWKENQINGKGTLTRPDGSYYIGNWKGGLRHGSGTIYDKNNTIIEHGMWENDTLKSSNLQ